MNGYESSPLIFIRNGPQEDAVGDELNQDHIHEVEDQEMQGNDSSIKKIDSPKNRPV